MRSREHGGGPSPEERGELVRSPETKDVSEEKSTYDQALELRDKVFELRDKINEIMEDPVLIEAADPAVRTAINTLISIADVFPGVGEFASWGADAAKIWADRKYKRERKEAEERGEDPDEVEKSKFDLTPDVPVEVAVLTEVIEPFVLGTFPSHAIESGIQLYHDWPKLRDAAGRLSEYYHGRAEISPKELEMMDVIDAEYEVVTQ